MDYIATVGIVTIDDYINYGNRLQNYALTKLLEAEGFQVINTIRVYTKEDWVKKTENPLKRIVKYCIPYSIIKEKIYKKSVQKTGLLKKRENNFIEFIHSYTSIIEPIVVNRNKDAVNILEKYHIDCYITGSDQVWNPYYAGESFHFLTFAPKNKRFSFAASIGSDEIPDNMRWYYERCFDEMKYISVREESAAKQIKKLCGKEVDITLDPTLLLSCDEWNSIIKKPMVSLEKKYICTYFLGKKPDIVDRFAEEKGLPVYELNNVDYEDFFTLNPAEFLYMICNAEYVFTDSFHAVAFSIKFKKEFYVFDREQQGINNMFSRIEYITKRFGLENRIQDRINVVEQRRINDWDRIETMLSNERRSSLALLKKAMGI